MLVRVNLAGRWLLNGERRRQRLPSRSERVAGESYEDPVWRLVSVVLPKVGGEHHELIPHGRVNLGNERIDL